MGIGGPLQCKSLTGSTIWGIGNGKTKANKMVKTGGEPLPAPGLLL